MVLGEGLLGAEQETQHEICGEIALRLAEELAGPTRGVDDRPHRHAEVVLGVGIPVAVAEAAPVRGLDVGNAIGGAPDFGLVAGLGIG